MDNLEITVEGSDDNGATRRDLLEAFIDDASLRPIRKSEIPAEPESGDMGVTAMILLVLALNPGLLTKLTECVEAWLETTKSHGVLKVRGPGGEATLEFDGKKTLTKDQVAQFFDIAAGLAGEPAE